MLDQFKLQRPLLLGSGTVLFALVASLLLMPLATTWVNEWGKSKVERRLIEEGQKPSAVFPLAALSPQARKEELAAIADQPIPSLDRSRARYLLASDWIEQYEGGLALRQLEDLEKSYPPLAPYILLKRGRAEELTNNPQQAQITWKQLLEQYPDSPVVVEALYSLGRYDRQYEQQALKAFPHHPRTLDAAREKLKDNPKQLQFIRLLVKYAPDDPRTKPLREQLQKDFAQQLTPQDWEAIATGYWQTGKYNQAAAAYGKAPATPLNRYRAGRGRQLKDKKAEAKAAYLILIKAFPDAEETGLALRRLASLSSPAEAMGYLDQAIAKFPKEAPDALRQKAQLLAKQDGKAATQAWQSLLKRYPRSDAAANYRWEQAKKWSTAGDLLQAWQWAQPITQDNPNSSLAPKAGFWVGKWAQQLGRSQDAKAAFRHVLRRHPQSYYAWRSAVQLGWPVGDYNNLRQQSPQLTPPPTRLSPTAGSPAFRELYHLRQDWDARRLFEAETAQREMTVAEEFTDGLLKLNRGQYLSGINQIWSLKQKESPQAQKDWQALRQTQTYWQALFPFPYYELITQWSKANQLNPLLVTSLMRQESRFEKKIRSPVGATGLMQVMPATAKWISQQTDIKDYDLTDPEDSIRLGTWYLNYTHTEYGNNTILAIASYNAGPGNVNKWLAKYGMSDPDSFVEKIPFRETKGYVESVLGNYWNYLRIYNPEVQDLFRR